MRNDEELDTEGAEGAEGVEGAEGAGAEAAGTEDAGTEDAGTEDAGTEAGAGEHEEPEESGDVEVSDMDGFCAYRVEQCHWTPERLEAYLNDRQEWEYWDYNGDNGLLRRHHIMPRGSLFGHNPEDQPAWERCPRRSQLQESRRTVMIGPGGQITCIFDNWAFPGTQVPEECNQRWWGFTDFAIRGTVHLGRPPQECEEPYYRSPDDEDLDEAEEDEEEEEEVPSTTETPGSDASTLRSRTPPRDGSDRRVGYLHASPILELYRPKERRQVEATWTLTRPTKLQEDMLTTALEVSPTNLTSFVQQWALETVCSLQLGAWRVRWTASVARAKKSLGNH